MRGKRLLALGKRGREGETCPMPIYRSAMAKEWEAAMDEFADSPAFHKAASFADDSRAEFYFEREESQL